MSEINFGLKSELMVYRTYENVAGNFETLRQRFLQNYRARQIERLGVTFPIRRLRVK